MAEDLLTALAKTWFAWDRLNDDPVRYVRRVLVATSVSWWRRKWTGELPSEHLPETPHLSGHSNGMDERAAGQDLWIAIGRLPARQRAVVVLRYYEDLSEADTADLSGCSDTEVPCDIRMNHRLQAYWTHTLKPRTIDT